MNSARVSTMVGEREDVPDSSSTTSVSDFTP